MNSDQQNYQNIIISTMAFPPIPVMSLFISDIPCMIELEENYQKKSFRNKYTIGTHQGKQRLSIPLKKGKNSSMNIREVLLCYNEDWQKHHWNSIQTAYGRSAYFFYYKNELEQFIKTKYNTLVEFNLEFIKLFSSLVSYPIELRYSQTYYPNYGPEVLDFRSSEHIDFLLNVKQSPYYQVFQPENFLSGLSILDLLFHLGPDTIQYLSIMANSVIYLDNIGKS